MFALSALQNITQPHTRRSICIHSVHIHTHTHNCGIKETQSFNMHRHVYECLLKVHAHMSASLFPFQLSSSFCLLLFPLLRVLILFPSLVSSDTLSFSLSLSTSKWRFSVLNLRLSPGWSCFCAFSLNLRPSCCSEARYRVPGCKPPQWPGQISSNAKRQLGIISLMHCSAEL